jgi:hypothetical protein
VRRSLGIELTGPRTIQSFVMVHLGADFRSLVGDAKGVLYFLVDPAAGGPFVNHGADQEWVFMHGWDPEAEPMEAFTEDRCRDLVRAALADPTAEFEVLGVSNWHMSAQIADTYRSGPDLPRGRCGPSVPADRWARAEHGCRRCAQSRVEARRGRAGWADPSILDTYEAERRPVAQFNCDQSLAQRAQAVRGADRVRLHRRSRRLRTGRRRGRWPTRRVELSSRMRSPGRRSTSTCSASNSATSTTDLSSSATAPKPLRSTNRRVTTCHRRVPAADSRTDGSTTAPRRSISSTRPGRRCCARAVSSRRRFPWATARSVEVEVWDDTFGISPDLCLVVRPDQHVAARCPVMDAADVLERLFPVTAEMAL